MAKIVRPELTPAALESLREMAEAAYATSDADDVGDAVALKMLLKWYDGREARDAEIAAEAAARERPVARPESEWHEDFGDVLWWRFPIVEPPYAGSPLDTDWPGYHTHWTPIAIPEEVQS